MKTRVINRELANLFDIAPLDFIDNQPYPKKKISKPNAIQSDGETKEKPNSKILKIENRKKRLLEKKKIRIKTLTGLIDRLPEENEDFFIIGGGNIDAIHIIPVSLLYLGHVDQMYVSTWSMTWENIEDLLDMFDKGKIKELNILISIFFQGRYKSTCHFLRTEMKRRNQKIVICQNHAKVILMKAGSNHLVYRGSANFTCNPRIEQADFSNNKSLYDFNKTWMDEVLSKVQNVNM